MLSALTSRRLIWRSMNEGRAATFYNGLRIQNADGGTKGIGGSRPHKHKQNSEPLSGDTSKDMLRVRSSIYVMPLYYDCASILQCWN